MREGCQLPLISRNSSNLKKNLYLYVFNFVFSFLNFQNTQFCLKQSLLVWCYVCKTGSSRSAPTVLSPISIESVHVVLTDEWISFCKPGQRLISCNNGFPIIKESACYCPIGSVCQAICSRKFIRNFELETKMTEQLGKPARAHCSPGNVVLGCHARPEKNSSPWYDLHYFPSKDINSCICYNAFRTYCVATCGKANVQYHKVRGNSRTGNMTVHCSGEDHVLSCGVLPFALQSRDRYRRPIVAAYDKFCHCSNTHDAMCYAICGDLDLDLV